MGSQYKLHYLWCTTLANIAIAGILLASVLQTIWALKLNRLQLIGIYRLLFVYLLTTAVMSALGLGLHELFLRSPSPVTASLYGWHFVVYQPLAWTLFFCLIVDLFRNVLSGFKVCRFSRNGRASAPR